MNYDVFISYRSADRPWADKLAADLTKKSLTVFYDQNDLTTGANWREVLDKAIESSNHMVVLWSHLTSKTDWVQYEMSRFVTHIDPEVTGQAARMRRLLIVALDEQNKPYDNIQQINFLLESGAYTKGAASVDANLWSRTVEKLYNDIRVQDDSIEVPHLILTTTLDEFAKIQRDQQPAPGSAALSDVLKRMDLKTDDFDTRYGVTREDWKPFRGEKNIATMLTELKDEVNRSETRIRWAPLANVFWSTADTDQNKAREEAMRLQNPTRFSLVVVDPVALYHTIVHDRFHLLDELRCFDHPKVLTMVLAPFPMPDRSSEMKRLVQRFARRIFESYYMIANAPISPANCCVSFGDDEDIRRLVLAALRGAPERASGGAGAGSAYINPSAGIVRSR